MVSLENVPEDLHDKLEDFCIGASGDLGLNIRKAVDDGFAIKEELPNAVQSYVKPMAHRQISWLSDATGMHKKGLHEHVTGEVARTSLATLHGVALQQNRAV